MRMHTARRRRGFERFTFADMQTVKCALLSEVGAELETHADAGPHVYDFSNFFHPGAIGTQEYTHAVKGEVGTDNEPNETQTRAYSREFTFDLIDGMSMGLDGNQDYTSGQGTGMEIFGHDNFGGAEYVVIRDLQWEFEFSPTRPYDAWVYRYLQDNTGDEEDTLVRFPKFNALAGGFDTLQDYLDSLYQGVTETAGLNDLWSSMAEVLVAPYAVSLLRLPYVRPAESVLDIYSSTEQIVDQVAMGPLGYMRYKEMNNPIPDVAINWDPTADLIGTQRSGAAAEFHNRLYRPYEPYDELHGVILRRDIRTYKYWQPAISTVQEHLEIDADDANVTTEQGFPAHPSIVNARRIKCRGGFKGDIVISRRDPRPLVLSIATLPIRLPNWSSAGGTSYALYTRHFMNMIRWHVTANIKIR